MDQLDLVFMRVDPPYSLEYVTLCQILALVPPPTVIVNRPEGILSANEKLLALHFADLMPETIVSRDPRRLRRFLDEVGGKMVVKPLSGFGGGSVFLVEKGDSNRNVILETMTADAARPVMAQKYLPVTTKGDKRIILLAGEPIGAVLRLPAKGEHRANLHAGGRCQKTNLAGRDQKVCNRLGPWLRRHGLWLAGIDLVAGYLTEINVTSPTLVQQINALARVQIEKRILDFCDYLCKQARTQSKIPPK